ncbi:protein required for normal CLN1 and CLN2 G1 cyclin expression [Actinomortierella ambigua]|uniref:Protein required for normal CLN1 and CLN2 G1 cyclin expression n=1 Tax=Actinomortierella ambigua TaxID=1343610 RepID=A0A9P6TYN3_9FUNG|nr:protein required for normal CLN1 and CLN2 G1 cyclin expression [Actinomortierella ambigua]
MNHHPSATLDIPLKGSDNVLALPRDEIPPLPELVGILRSEEVPLGIYVDAALEVTRQRRIDDAIKLLIEGLNAPYEPNPRPRLPLHNLLAALYTRKGYQPGISAQERTTYWTEAGKHLTSAEKINAKDETMWIGKGLLLLARGSLDDALRHFKQVLNGSPRCVPALMGIARIQYTREQYPQALTTYRMALRINPGSQPDPRIGMGLCFFKLGMYAAAAMAFERASELNPNSAMAHTLLAIMQFNKSRQTNLPDNKVLEVYQQGVDQLRKAYAADRRDPIVGLCMGRHFELIKNTEAAMAFATRASNQHGLKNLQAEGFYIMGKIHHQTERYADACACYGKAVHLNPDHLPAQFGLGQTLLFKSDIASAIVAFEKILAKEPKCVEAMAILGTIFGRSPGTKAKALEYFKTATNIIHERNTMAMQDPLLFTEMAQLLEQTDNVRATKAYMQALGICSEKAETVDYMPELLNNVAAMNHIDGRLDAAEGSYNKALDLCAAKIQQEEGGAGAGGDVDMATEATITTIRYNMARLYEERNQIEQAEQIYQGIAAKYHGYADAHLRLGVIAQGRGELEEAGKLYKEVFGMIDNKNVDAWTLMGMLQLKQNQIRNSRKTLERVVREINRHDVYALLALGNNQLTMAREEKENMAGKQEMYKKAFEFFDKVLKIDAMNAFAANGIAISLAIHGHQQEAKEMFSTLREAASHIPAVGLNLALVCAELGQYHEAVRLYQTTSKRSFNNQDENVLLSMAKAQYCEAKQDKDAVKMLQALSTAQKAYRLNPSDKTPLYDIALIQQSYAQIISDRAQNERTVADIQAAIRGLGVAKSMLKSLIAVPKEEHVYYERDIATQREKHGDSLLTILQRKLKDQQVFEEDRERAMEETRKKREAERLRREEEERKKLAAKEEDERKIAEARRQMDEGVKETQRELDEWNREREREKKKYMSDDDIISDNEGEGGEGGGGGGEGGEAGSGGGGGGGEDKERRSKGRRRRRKEDRESDGDEPDAKKPKRERKKEPKEGGAAAGAPKRKGKLRKRSEIDGTANREKDTDGEDAADETGGDDREDTGPKRSSHKVKSKEIIESEDEEDSD